MEVVSTSNLVSSETKKTTTACNFQHDYAMRGEIGSYTYIQIEAIGSFVIEQM